MRIIFVLLMLTGCVAKENATDFVKKSDVEATEMALLTSGVIVEDLCKVAERCRGVTLKTCVYKTGKIEALPDAMGAPYGRYPTVHDLTTGLEKKEIAVIVAALGVCRLELVKLSCGDDHIVEAFGKEGGKDLTKIARLLRVNNNCEKLIKTY